MSFNDDRELIALGARLDDLCGRVGGGELAITAFLSPRELAYSERYLRQKGADFRFFGGYDGAERRRVYILPDYMSDAFEGGCVDTVLSEYGYSTEITPLRILGSGYRKLSHRDFLGSLLGLGIERSVVGDIVLLGDEEREALVFCDSAISEYIFSQLVAVANDKVRVSRADTGDIQIPDRKTQPIRDTVASPRLDAVVAALCNLSRERARAAVVSGLVEIDFESEERPDRTLSAGTTVSVRGFGRYRVTALSDKTKKGRYRLEAEKYV